MRALYLIIFLFSSSFCFAQQNIYYLKNNKQRVPDKDSADYVRVVKPPDDDTGLYNVFEFYPGGQKKLIGKSVRPDAFNLDGPCVTYYENGFRQKTATYKNGAIEGDEYVYFPNGQLYTQKKYGKIKVDVYLAVTQKVKIITCNDTSGKALVVEGNGHFVGYNQNLTHVFEQGDVKDGMRVGQWEGQQEELGFKFKETYQDGEIITGTATAGGKTYTYKSRNVPPQYKDGMAAFQRYVQMNIISRSSIKGVAIITFTVDRTGKAGNLNLENVSNGFIAEAVRVVKNAQAWTPALYFGIPITHRLTVPVYFN